MFIFSFLFSSSLLSELLFSQLKSEDIQIQKDAVLFLSELISCSKNVVQSKITFNELLCANGILPILSELITPDDVKRSLYLMGLPLDTNKNQILKYLSQFNINHSNLVVSEKILNNFGSVIVKFYNEDIANEAKNWIKNNKFDDKVIYVENLLFVVNKGNTIS